MVFIIVMLPASYKKLADINTLLCLQNDQSSRIAKPQKLIFQFGLRAFLHKSCWSAEMDKPVQLQRLVFEAGVGTVDLPAGSMLYGKKKEGWGRRNTSSFLTRSRSLLFFKWTLFTKFTCRTLLGVTCLHESQRHSGRH